LDAPDKIEGYCCKCGKTFKDIGKHLTGSAVRCREKNEYQLINGTTRAAERLSWTAVWSRILSSNITATDLYQAGWYGRASAQ
jgi:hypothetical protein